MRLDRHGDVDTWRGPRPDLCRATLARNQHQLHAAADDLRDHAWRLDRARGGTRGGRSSPDRYGGLTWTPATTRAASTRSFATRSSRSTDSTRSHRRIPQLRTLSARFASRAPTSRTTGCRRCATSSAAPRWSDGARAGSHHSESARSPPRQSRYPTTSDRAASPPSRFRRGAARSCSVGSTGWNARPSTAMPSRARPPSGNWPIWPTTCRSGYGATTSSPRRSSRSRRRT